MERRRERGGGLLWMLAALLLAAMLAGMVWRAIRDDEETAPDAVYVYSEAEAQAHG